MHKQKVLVIGGDGFIGRHLAAQLTAYGNLVEQTSRQPNSPHWKLKLEDCLNGIPDWMKEFALIFNCAGVVGFVGCETHPLAYRINVDAPMAIARQLSESQVLVHLSSDAIDVALNTGLGQQKALAEIGLLSTGRCVVVRLGKVTGANMAKACFDIITASKQPPPFLSIAT